jgi:hypothetical protein
MNYIFKYIIEVYRKKEFKDILTSFNDITIFENRILTNLLKNNSIKKYNRSIPEKRV